MVLHVVFCFFFFFKQKTAYEISECDWSSDVCSSDLIGRAHVWTPVTSRRRHTRFLNVTGVQTCALPIGRKSTRLNSSHIQKSRMPSSACYWSSDVCSSERSEEHTSELQSHSEISYAVFCLRSEERRVGKE